MKKLIYLAMLLAFPYVVFAQKPPIDTSVYNKWPTIGDRTISNDGSYCTYTINDPVKGDYTTLRSLHNDWQKTLKIISAITFTSDSKFFIFKDSPESLALIRLGTDSVIHINGVERNDFERILAGPNERLAYLLKGTQQLVFRDLKSGQEKTIDHVLSFQPNPNGEKDEMIIQLADPNNTNGTSLWAWLDLKTNALQTFFHGSEAYNFIFDHSKQQLFFIAKDDHGTQLWSYKKGAKNATTISGNGFQLPEGYELQDIRVYNEGGNRLVVTLGKANKAIDSTSKKYNVPLNIWRYNDAVAQRRQLSDLLKNDLYGSTAIAILDLKNRKVNIVNANFPSITENYIVFQIIPGPPDEMMWNKRMAPRSTILSLSDGSERPLDTLIANPGNLGKRYLVYYDQQHNGYFSYEAATGKRRNLTQHIKTTWRSIAPDIPVSPYFFRGWGISSPLLWTDNDEWVLIRDRYDIWQLDPSGDHAPINITNGYGRKHHIFFNIPDGNKYFKSGETLLLGAFNFDTKDNGFFKVKTGVSNDPEKLSMGPYAYMDGYEGDSGAPNNKTPVKAKDKNAWIVERQSAKDFPNLFYTEDLKSFHQLTDLTPQKQYNWMTTELLTWKTSDGIQTQGILYKPENFDPHKKYPVIFHYYQLKSGGLNQFHYPEPAEGNVNLEWYVSHGYLVFVPDFYYIKGKPYESALHILTSAVAYLKQFPFVDGKHLGMTGKSYGGLETNYFVTHTHLFAAACSASSVSDFISYYGQNLNKTVWDVENSQMRVPGTLWDFKKWYIDNSPVFNADQVTTPLLMMQNTHDDICPFVNALELFTALRRLGKKAWLLEYEDGVHGVDGASAMDYDRRLQQFFDHYLKGAPAPKWMVEGIPARLKGIDDGFALEPTGVEPGPGLIDARIKHSSKKHKK